MATALPDMHMHAGRHEADSGRCSCGHTLAVPQSVSTAEKVILEMLAHAEALALINLQDLV